MCLSDKLDVWVDEILEHTHHATCDVLYFLAGVCIRFIAHLFTVVAFVFTTPVALVAALLRIKVEHGRNTRDPG